MQPPRTRVEGRSRLGSPTAFWIAIACCVLFLDAAAAQYGNYNFKSPAASPAPPAPRGPNMAGGTFWLNPYANGSARAPSPKPLGGTSGYFGGAPAAGTMTARPKQKPFSSVKPPAPLITSREAARLEVARGLWWY